MRLNPYGEDPVRFGLDLLERPPTTADELRTRCLEAGVAVAGHRRVSAALRSGESLVEARLAAEVDEPVPGTGRSAVEYFAVRVRPDVVQDWAAAHGTSLKVPAEAA